MVHWGRGGTEGGAQGGGGTEGGTQAHFRHGLHKVGEGGVVEGEEGGVGRVERTVDGKVGKEG